MFEGIDGSGKSTQCTLLDRYLSDKGIEHVLLAFPDRNTDSGKEIDRYLRDDSIKKDPKYVQTLFSKNRWECKDKIESLLLQGKIVICDRYSFSGMAYGFAEVSAYNRHRHI